MMNKFAKARARRRAAPKRPFRAPAAPILFAPLREAQPTPPTVDVPVADRDTTRVSCRVAIAYRIVFAVGVLMIARVLAGIPAQPRERRGVGRHT